MQPTAIQESVIPLILSGKDVIAKAQTGSGKTAAFCLPALDLLARYRDKTILVLTPTRELALQVCEEMQKFSKYLDIIPTAIYGGEPVSKQLQRLRRDNRILVGTPGRLLDLFRSKYLRDFSPLLVVLDESDEMLNMGFLEDIQAIFAFLPKERQTLLFSATISSQIKKIASQLLQKPVFCDQSSENNPHEDIHQICYRVEERERTTALIQLLQFHAPLKSIVFCNTKRQVDELSAELIQSGFSTLCLHGDMSQKDRQNSIERFRRAKQKILVATDVAGRGINVTDVSYVFNYELPFSAEGYTHRIGRTGRMGNKGTAISLVSSRQLHFFKQFPKNKISLSQLPSTKDIKSKLQSNFSSSLAAELIHNDAEDILTLLQKNHPIEEIALRLISRYWRTHDTALIEKKSAPPKKTFSKKHGGSYDRPERDKRRDFKGNFRKRSSKFKD